MTPDEHLPTFAPFAMADVWHRHTVLGKPKQHILLMLTSKATYIKLEYA